MTRPKLEINQQDLKYFSAHALSGLLANPLYSSVEGQKYLNMKNLTIERLAVSSALELMENIVLMTEALDKAIANENEAHAAVLKMTSSLGDQ